MQVITSPLAKKKRKFLLFGLQYDIINRIVEREIVGWHMTYPGIRRCEMGALKIVLTILFIIVCVALVILVLMQEGKSAGLGSIGGAAETYWGKNKARSMEGRMVQITKILAVAFMLLAMVLNLNVF